MYEVKILLKYIATTNNEEEAIAAAKKELVKNEESISSITVRFREEREE